MGRSLISPFPTDERTGLNLFPSFSSVSTWCGRTIDCAKQEINSLSSRITEVVQKTLAVTSSLVSDSSAFTSVLRRFNGQIFDAVESLRNIPGYFNKFRTAGNNAIGMLDALSFIGDVKYFSSKEYVKDNKLVVSSRIAIFVANTSWTLTWLQEMSFLNLCRTAKALGEVRVFSFIPKLIASIPVIREWQGLNRVALAVGNVRVFGVLNRLSLGVIAGKALTLYYIFSIADNVRTLASGAAGGAKTQTILDLSYNVSELALETMLTMGVVSVGGLGVVGTACVVTALASFAFKTLNTKE